MQLTDEIKQRLPLPLGVYKAGYFGDAREVVIYQIASDTMVVRYDWIGDADDTKKCCFMTTDFDYQDALLKGEEMYLFERRVEYMRERFGKL